MRMDDELGEWNAIGKVTARDGNGSKFIRFYHRKPKPMKNI